MIQNGRIADTLHLGGHNATLLEVDYTIPPGSVKSVRHANYWPVSIDLPDRVREIIYHGDLLSFGIYNEYRSFKEFFKLNERYCFALLRNQELVDQIKAQNFDAIVYEQYDFCPMVIAHLLKIEVRIWTASCPMIAHQVAILGVPFEASYVPASMNNPTGDKMSFTDRFWNIVRLWTMCSVHIWSWDEFDVTLKRMYGDDFPKIVDIAKTADVTFINTDELIDFPRPLPPNVVHVGGLGVEAGHQELEAPFSDIMTKGDKGVVLFSLGSVVDTRYLPDGYLKNAFDTVAKFKEYYFIVKLSKNDQRNADYAAKYDNVYVNDWIPQAGVLAHPRLKLFVSHGGYNSIIEAATFSVPMMLIGIVFDQPRNARLVERNGWGLSLDKTFLKHGPEEFEQKLVEMLTNDKYKKNAERINRLMRTKPQTGEQKFLSYIKFLEENDGHLPELKSIASDLSTVEYHNLDILAVAIALVVLVLLIVFTGLLSVLKLLKSCFTSKSKQE
ncbi:unnamed protein product [Bursaphelenchus okinawaensis]|uniref:glucuronosyltransferase n=1 Tax=Bursaphelenchus okinawaensis TaxID=465554 RepID=A0A811L7E0_9BILA|nr:unnamed protein product [Bursaphelenchus okinawaensis]CAG9119460.1 unnamed protein product [Bursaphelenchus okinawaensis]